MQEERRLHSRYNDFDFVYSSLFCEPLAPIDNDKKKRKSGKVMQAINLCLCSTAISVFTQCLPELYRKTISFLERIFYRFASFFSNTYKNLFQSSDLRLNFLFSCGGNSLKGRSESRK